MENEKDLLNLAKNFGWKYISQYYNLSEEFIEKYKDELSWYFISKYQELSEEFIESHMKYLWSYFVKYQKLSFAFLIKYRKIIYWGLVKENKNISVEIFKEALPNNDSFFECCWCGNKLVKCKNLNVYMRYCPKCLR